AVRRPPRVRYDVPDRQLRGRIHAHDGAAEPDLRPRAAAQLGWLGHRAGRHSRPVQPDAFPDRHRDRALHVLDRLEALRRAGRSPLRSMKQRYRFHTSLFLALAAAACGGGEPVTVANIGEPLPGLSAEQRARFEEGMVLFNRVFTEADGLGPLFNDNQCSACHTSPATGGTGDQFVTRMSRTLPDGTCDPLIAEGGENVRLRAT